MKSRAPSASITRAAAPPASTRSSMIRPKKTAAEPTVATLATAPSPSGQAAPLSRLHPTAMHRNTATCTTLSHQKSSTAPQREYWNFSRASSPSQPSRIEWARKSRAPVSCHRGAGDRKNVAPSSPTAPLITVIMFGVIDVLARRRVKASDTRRSKCRDMNPSRCLINERSNQRSALATSPVATIGKRPSTSAGGGAWASVRSSSATRALASAALAAAFRTAPESSVSTTATSAWSTARLSRAIGASRSVRSQLACGTTLPGITTTRRPDAARGTLASVSTAARVPPRPSRSVDSVLRTRIWL